MVFLAIITTVNCRKVLHGESDEHAAVSLATQSLERVFKALEKLIAFYKRQYKNMILDGVYGLRVLEGKLTLFKLKLTLLS